MDGRGPFGHPGHQQMQPQSLPHHNIPQGYAQYGMSNLMPPPHAMNHHMGHSGNAFGLPHGGGNDFGGGMPGQYFGGAMSGMPGPRPHHHHHHHHQQQHHHHHHHHHHQMMHQGAPGKGGRERRRPQPAAQNGPAENLTGSYVKTTGLLPIDERGFKAAGILPWRQDPTTNSYEVLLGVSRRGDLSIFGGVRDQNNEGPIDTALREFCEETNNAVLEGTPGILADIRGRFQHNPTVIWMLGGKYALYPLDVSNLSVRHIRQVVELPTSIPSSLSKCPVRSPAAEMDGAQWVDLAAMTLALPRMPFHRFITSMVSSDPAFRAWARSPSTPPSTDPFDVKKCLPCRYWEAGTCTKGNTCDYMHAGPAGRAKPANKRKCKYFAAGHCRNGMQCAFQHGGRR